MSKQHASWMSNEEQNIATKQLFQVALPGACDAGTYAIDLMSPWHNSGSGTVLKCYAVQYARAQTLDLYDQALRGVRYFDLSVAAIDSDVDGKRKYTFKSRNGLLGGDVCRAFSDLCMFAKCHRREVLVVHVTETADFTEQDHLVLQYELERRARKRLAPVDRFDPTSTLRDFWDADVNIVVVYPTVNNRTRLWPLSHVCTNVQSTSALEAVANACANNIRPGLRVVRAVARPSLLYATLHPWASAVSVAETYNTENVQPAMRPGLNCVAVHAVERSATLIDTIVLLNRIHGVLARENGPSLEDIDKTRLIKITLDKKGSARGGECL